MRLPNAVKSKLNFVSDEWAEMSWNDPQINANEFKKAWLRLNKTKSAQMSLNELE